MNKNDLTKKQHTSSKFLVGRNNILHERQKMNATGFIKMGKRKIEDDILLSNRTLTVNYETPLAQVQKLMQENDLESVPVIENGRFLGIVTRKTIKIYLPELQQASPQGELFQQTIKQTSVGDVMEPNPTTILPSATIKKAAKTMLSEEIDAIPVVDENDMWFGTLRLEDILNMVARS